MPTATSSNPALNPQARLSGIFFLCLVLLSLIIACKSYLATLHHSNARSQSARIGRKLSLMVFAMEHQNPH